jgi:alpha-L-rhamnosidase
MLAQGATCIWEQWDGENSRCHSSYLSIGAWFIQGILGLRPDPEQPGFRHFIVKPGLYEKLGEARGQCNTLYGKIACAWKEDARHFTLNLEIPVNTTASIFLPASDSMTITESGQPLARVAGVRLLRMEEGRAVLEAGSGSYRFGSLRPSPP